jgi:hypothetical protein
MSRGIVGESADAVVFIVPIDKLPSRAADTVTELIDRNALAEDLVVALGRARAVSV